MAGDLAHIGTVDDQLLLGDTHRQQFANPLPRHGVKVLLVHHMAFAVDSPIENSGCVIGSGGQTQ